MQKALRTIILAVPVALAGALPAPVQAQTYQVDCAILLCLAGGWPASVPCTRARAEFIRRITPWPVEPPLQIWRCPMGAAFGGGAPISPTERLFDIATRPPLEGPDASRPTALPLIEAQATEQADIDISGDAFDFVRSIRVYHIQFSQERKDNGGCFRTDRTRLGTYGLQGDYRWARSSIAEVPAASGLPDPGHCREVNYRSVFVDWRDHAGTYGFEEVRY